MAIKLEEMFNEIRYPALITTDKAITSASIITGAQGVFSGTLSSGAFSSGAQTVTGAVVASGSITGATFLANVNGTVTTSGNPTPAIVMGSSAIGIYFGSGTPTVTAKQGALYLNAAGSAVDNRIFVMGLTSWVSVTTAL